MAPGYALALKSRVVLEVVIKIHGMEVCNLPLADMSELLMYGNVENAKAVYMAPNHTS